MKKSKIPHVSGIYCIKNTLTGDCYVGHSFDVLARWKQHLRSLKKGTHNSKLMQLHWNIYGDVFVMHILEAYQINGVWKKKHTAHSEMEKKWQRSLQAVYSMPKNY